MNSCFSPNRMSLIIVTALALTASCLGDEPKEAARLTLSQMSLEVTALQTLRNLSLTEAQLKSFRRLAKESVSKARLRKDGKGSDKFRQALAELHRALRANSEDGRIDELTDKLDEIREQDKPQLEDEVEITEEAQRRAPEALRLLYAGQFLAGLAEEVDDPRELLIGAIATVRDLSPEKWQEARGDLAAHVGRLSAGLDSEKADRIGSEAVQLLIAVRSLSDAEFTSQKPELEKRAQKIVGDIGPLDVLRNVMEYTLAELLSNPRLPQAIDARLKQEASKKSGPETPKKSGPEAPKKSDPEP